MKISDFFKTATATIALLTLGGLSLSAQSLKDTDGNVYKTIKYGLQEWTASNFNAARFRNGDAIPEAKTNEEWLNACSSGKPVWCYYKNDPLNGKTYGKLYNWYAINDPRGLAPKGWHVTKNEDWMTMVKNLLGVDVAGFKLKNTTGWKTKNATNAIGFAALPGGLRDNKGEFKELGSRGQWWSNSVPVEVIKSNQIYSFSIKDNTSEVSYLKMDKESGLSVRIVKD